MIGRSLPNEDDYYRPRVEIEGTGWCQPFTDGPLNNPDNPIEDTYLQLIASAQKMLYITTPYYAVEESMQKALVHRSRRRGGRAAGGTRHPGQEICLHGGGDLLG